MSVLTQKASLSPIPQSAFTQLRDKGFLPPHFDTLGHLCAYTGLPAKRVTAGIADALLMLAYSLPYEHRRSAVHIEFSLLLAHQAVTMFRRCEIDHFVAEDGRFARKMIAYIDDLRSDLDWVRGELVKEACK